MTGSLTFDDYKILLSNNNLQGNSNIYNQLKNKITISLSAIGNIETNVIKKSTKKKYKKV